MNGFEEELQQLIDRSNDVKTAVKTLIGGGYDDSIEIWMNDVEIFYNKYLREHPLKDRIHMLLIHRKNAELAACLKSIQNDRDFIDKMNGVQMVNVPKYKAQDLPEHDVFISHANKDKKDFVEDLYQSLNKLGVDIFYDKESLEWGDNWKNKILYGTQNAEFAIIVISENFFDREWTERELSAFLNRQNRNGQKLILPIVHNITTEELKEKYPNVADIQAIDSQKYSCDEIALMFAKQLIKRLKIG